MNKKSVADTLGPWVDPDWDSGLVQRCRESWNVPIRELINEMLATFLRQDIATDLILEESILRLDAGYDDDSEMFDGELAEKVLEAQERRRKRIDLARGE